MKKVLLVALVAMLASSASAALLVYEGFGYTPAVDALNNVSANGGTGLSANWVIDWTTQAADVTSGSLSYGALLTTGNKGQTKTGVDANANATSMKRSLSSALPGGKDLWISFLMNIDTTQDPAPPSTAGQWFGFEFGAGGTYAGKHGSNVKWVLGSNPAGPPQNSGIDVAPGTHLLVQQYAWNGSSYDVSLFIDPGTGTLGGAGPGMAASATQAGVSIIPSSYVAFSAPAVGSFDEYRIGETYADVTPIPEPASILLLVSGLVGAYKLRRRS